MQQYIATFHTHLSALRTCNTLKKAGISDARLAPVPRKLSSSCGTCVFYCAEEAMISCMDTDVESVYQQNGTEYTIIYTEE
ncbi:MAG: DUF3343 domain-containing protein [Oscillospiraceae bacterium]|nr:DUF3343 domain-containing protein [Oscillospiraceae bacterium]